MEFLSTILTICTIHIIAVMSPGPDFFLSLRNTLMYSKKIGIYTALGYALGTIVHIAYCLAGIGFLIMQSILIAYLLKMAAAVYLIWIGFKTIQAPTKILPKNTHQKPQSISTRKAIKMGFLANILNPKAGLFFLSIFSLIITPETPVWALALPSIIIPINTFIWFSLVAIGFSHANIRNLYRQFKGFLHTCFGTILIGAGIELITNSYKNN